jgi:hypothetical protein
MSLYSLFEQREMYWLMRESDPREIPLPETSPFPGWSVFNPLVLLPEGFGGRPTSLAAGDGLCLVATPRIDFRTTIDDPEAADIEAKKILQWLQYVSGQIGLGSRIVAHALYPDGRDGAPVRAHFSDKPAVRIVRHVRAGAITFERIRAALEKDPSMSVPVYSDVLFDAINAAADGDYRKTILYSAIAVEVMAATRIDEMYDVARSVRPSDLRVVAMPVGAGHCAKKDPIFVELRKSARRNFKFWLHELPLYISRRSLMVEKPALYEGLLKLHHTRNDLVHGGGGELADRLSIDYEGAKRTLGVAVDTYSWFGASGRYVTMHGHELEAG